MNTPLPFKENDVVTTAYQSWDQPFVIKKHRDMLRLVPIRNIDKPASSFPTPDGLIRSNAPFKVIGQLVDDSTIKLYNPGTWIINY